jgi:carbamoyltransferase
LSLILGIASSHDASACLFRDGRLIAAIAEERLTRVKCDGGRLPQHAIEHVLCAAGATRRDVDVVATSYGHFPERYFRRETAAKELERVLVRAARRLAGTPKATNFSSGNLLKHLRSHGGRFESHFRRARFLEGEAFRPDAAVHFHDHHLTHAAGAAFYSGAAEAAIITLDGEGDLDMHFTASLWRDGRLERRRVSDTPGNSPGFFYETITKLLGFTPLRHEGKVLGLAAMADPQPLLGAMQRALRASPDARDFDSDFAGQPRAYDRRAEYLASVVAGQPRERVAAAAQQALEDAVLPVCRSFLAECGLRQLALNGGVFANVKLNQRLAALPEVDRVFVFPGMSDTGNSIGAALLSIESASAGWMRGHGSALKDVYWGPEYSAADIRAEIERCGLRAEALDGHALIERAAHAIHDGQVVGWFQGRMEFGPRALGNRSMLARATEAGINQSLNARLARTEFMPFAPSCLDEHAASVFAGVDKARHAAEFMTVTFDVHHEWRARVPAVVHVDGTARPQLVRRDRNPTYWALIERYRQLSGIPLVLNTSFNVHEEPIVCAPREALTAYLDGRIDCLAVGGFWLGARVK